MVQFKCIRIKKAIVLATAFATSSLSSITCGANFSSSSFLNHHHSHSHTQNPYHHQHNDESTYWITSTTFMNTNNYNNNIRSNVIGLDNGSSNNNNIIYQENVHNMIANTMNNNMNDSLLLSSSNNDKNNNNNGYVPYESRLETYIVPIIFFIIFVLGTIGNGTVIYIFYQHKSMRTVANVYILSLAAGDLALIFISVPFVSTIYTVESWPYGLAVCKISEFARDLSMGVTVFTLTSLSVQRYTATHHPIRYLSHKGRNTLTQANSFIWLLSISLAVPGAYNSYIHEMTVETNHQIKVCYPFPEHLGAWYAKTVVLTKFLAYYVIPLAVISVFYTLMARSLIRTTENPVGNNESQHKLLRNRKKISKIVLGLVVIFAICFFPNQVSSSSSISNSRNNS